MTALRHLIGAYLPRGAILLAGLTLAEATMGLLRDRLLAHAFGAGPGLDAYNAALVPPELLLDILVVGGVEAAFVPLYLGLRSEDGRAAVAFGRTIISLAVAAMLVVAVGLLVGAPLLADLAVPGFDAAARDEYVTVVRIVALTPAVFAASTVLGELLVAHRRFLGYGLAPLLYNGGIVAGTALLAGRVGVAAPALGALGGAILHLGIRLWDLRATGFTVRPGLALRTTALRTFLTLMVPRMVGEPIDPLTHLVATAIASALAAGSVTALTFAWNFESAGTSIIGVAFSVVAFPALSAAAAVGDRARFALVLRNTAVAIAVLSLAGAATMAVLGGLVVEVFLGGGAFDSAAVARTGAALAAFAVAVPLEGLTQLLARAVYATRNTVLPVIAALLGFSIMAATAPVLADRLGLVGIPFAYALGFAARVVVLLFAALWRTRTLAPAPDLAARSGGA